MTLVQCPKGHFYDANRFGSNCPFCGAGSATVGSEQTTVPIDQWATPADLGGVSVTEPGSVSVTEPRSVSVTEPMSTSVTINGDKTIPVSSDMLDGIVMAQPPVVGWLVCVQGVNKGKDYRLHQGRNFIGRASEMDVCICDDKTVSRSTHAVVVYDPRSNAYLAQPGDAKELFYINDQLVLNPTELKKMDKLNIGETTLMFVPLCGEDFHW